ncbi:uncharacterized protein G2W53_022350 [Senna tora]|uniref:Uncharacterized protein n=1 Tax=Senna tora TaxID=362788 RepID=A0A834TNI6_9FABA|nr:uncharacterized protein G2W53_022350 [Senna tora]
MKINAYDVQYTTKRSDENAKKSQKLKGGARRSSSSAAINGERQSSIYRGVTRDVSIVIN